MKLRKACIWLMILPLTMGLIFACQPDGLKSKRGKSISQKRNGIIEKTYKPVKQAAGKLEATEIYPLIKQATFQVFTQGAAGTSTGTGFFIYPGYLITNLHVVDSDADSEADPTGNISIGTLSEEKEELVGITEVAAIDVGHDLALLKIDPSKLPQVSPLALGTELPAVGETVYALGNPMGVVIGNFTNGQVSHVGPVEGFKTPVIVFTCPISPGNSGGPVVNRQGAVIGIASATFADSRSQNINIAQLSIHAEALLRTALAE